MRRRTRSVTVGSGEWRGRALRYPDDAALRPTMQRTKHSFFSSLGGALRGVVFADCFAGAGAVGIEALSLGAGFVHFIELQRDAVEALRANLVLCGAPSSRYHVHHARVAEVLARDPNPLRGVSVLFADPPYDADIERELLDALRPERFDHLDMAVIEHRSKHAVVAPDGFLIQRERKFGETTLTYLVQEGE
ncbi:MAG TPA: RsmD family RNA methyltransferase [Candidatus Krumholzibacteria bacterium]